MKKDISSLLEALGKLKVETGSLACLGCGWEHSCGVNGCAIIRRAIDKLCELEWIDPVLEPPASDDAVLVLVSGNPTDKLTVVRAHAVAHYYGPGAWVVEEFPEWENPTIHCWMPMPEDTGMGEARKLADWSVIRSRFTQRV